MHLRVPGGEAVKHFFFLFFIMLRCEADLHADQFFCGTNVCANAVCGAEGVAAMAAMMAGRGYGSRASSVFVLPEAASRDGTEYIIQRQKIRNNGGSNAHTDNYRRNWKPGHYGVEVKTAWKVVRGMRGERGRGVGCVSKGMDAIRGV